jgi:ABC-type antimicrobial peptide transport system permease subunit
MSAPAVTPVALATTEATLSQRQLILRRFARHRVAVGCAWFLPALDLIAVLAPCFAPHASTWRDTRFSFAPPMPPRWNFADGLHAHAVVTAARLIGMKHRRIIFRHLLPAMTSHIIVALTLSVPQMIIGETALSFLGLGLRPPVTSWGVMLQDCLNVEAVASYPWLLMPAGAITLTVLAFNFLGDGLRDAADPYG